MRGVEILSVASLAVLFGAICLGTISRYVGIRHFEWSFELAGMAFLWVSFLGTVLAEAGGENAAYTALDDRVGPHGRRVLDRIRNGLVLVTCLYLAASTLAMLARTGLMPSPVLRWPQAVQTLPMLVAAVLVFAVAMRRLMRSRRQE
jgi:TRAP-type C4-dicarboxylate transport system permease small subunit